jgi:hypothetical protein
MQHYRSYMFFLMGSLFVALAALAFVMPALAAGDNKPSLSSNSALQATEEATGLRNGECLECHGQAGQTFTLPNGEILDISINVMSFNTSIHGSLGYGCIQCHTDISEYPHPANTAQSLRDITLQMNDSCQNCHRPYFERTRNSVHAAAQEAGIKEAAVCVDCHGAHDTQRLNDPVTGELMPEKRTWVPATCAKCHNAIYQQYAESVHGSALIDEDNLDVPTCIDCHGVHDIEDPTTAAFRLKSPSICATCHTDEEKMAKYGLSTYVVNSYVADFHGTTVTLFEKQSPDHETNKAVCYDCHGIHDISRTRDPESGLKLQENLLARCQECHPDATANFPSAWLSHYEPSPEKYPTVYYVNLFYQFFIPGVLGSMGLLVLLDFSKKVYNNTRKPTILPSTSHAAVSPEASPQPGSVATSSVEEVELTGAGEHPETQQAEITPPTIAEPLGPPAEPSMETQHTASGQLETPPTILDDGPPSQAIDPSDVDEEPRHE